MREEQPGAFRDGMTWVIALAVFAAYLTISLSRLRTLNPMSWDLGIYTEYVKQYADLRVPVVDVRGAGFNLLGDHFQPIVALIAPFFRVFPSPATLLAAQAALTALSVFGVAGAGLALLGSPWRARAVALAYGFSWGLQQMIDFDFHEIAFAVPLLAFSLSALARGRWRACVAWALPLVFVKEDQGFTVAAIGLLVAAVGWRSGDRARTRGGALLALWGLAWSLLAITVIIPALNPQHHYYYWKDGAAPGVSPAGLLAQPFHGSGEKLHTLLFLLLTTVFICLGSPAALVTLPSLALRFVSANTAYWGTLWHYNATVMPILFISAIEVMGRWRRSGNRVLSLVPRFGPAAMVIAACAFAFQFPLRDLWDGTAYASGGPRAAAADAAMARVPDGAAVQTTLDLLAPLAARTDTFWIGNPGNPATRYVVFDGLDSGYSPAPGDVPAFIQQILPRDGYRVIFSDDDIYVFERS
ncbi:MAG: DUF2079 domain-containing protein [Streptosporangiales bacterium]|nr:DUF2079 domain-containing protein [Streptosporangiales bacterium]